MIIARPAAARGHVRASWLDSRHSFSFGQYYDPAWMGFSALRVLNEDHVDPGAGFPLHRHANMEILTCVLSGALAHRDSSGGEGVIRVGEWQWMSAGHGIEHSEFNASDSEPVHFLQIWIQPDRLNAQPAHAQRAAALEGEGWALLASRDGAEGGLPVRQDVRVHAARLEDGASLEFDLLASRSYWLHVAQGEIEVDGETLAAGDALGVRDEQRPLQLRGIGSANVLLFDLPPE